MNQIFEQLKELKSVPDIFRAINHPLRQEMIKMMIVNARTVTEIYVKLRLEQSVASQHLAILRKAGWVKTERDGKYIYYSIDEEKAQRYLALTSDLYRMMKKIRRMEILPEPPEEFAMAPDPSF